MIDPSPPGLVAFLPLGAIRQNRSENHGGDKTEAGNIKESNGEHHPPEDEDEFADEDESQDEATSQAIQEVPHLISICFSSN